MDDFLLLQQNYFHIVAQIQVVLSYRTNSHFIEIHYYCAAVITDRAVTSSSYHYWRSTHSLYSTTLWQHSLNTCKANTKCRPIAFGEFLRDHILDTLYELSNAHSWQKIVVATHCKIRGVLPWANHSMSHIGKCWRRAVCLFIGVSMVPQARGALWVGFNFSTGESRKYSIYYSIKLIYRSVWLGCFYSSWSSQ